MEADDLARFGARCLSAHLASTERDVALMAQARRRIRSIPDPMERAAIASRVFGKAWVEVVSDGAA